MCNILIQGALIAVVLFLAYYYWTNREYQGPGHGSAGRPTWATPSAGIEYQGPGHGSAGRPTWATPSAGVERCCGKEKIEELWDGGISLQHLTLSDEATLQNIDTNDFNTKSIAFYTQRPYI